MEKKFKFSDKPLTAKIIYASVVAILCLSAIIIGIVAAANKNKEPLPDPAPLPEASLPTETPGEEVDEPVNPEPKPLAFVSPLVGTVVKEHDLAAPVFSETLGAWRVHAGIDISAEEGATVYASEAGVVSAIFSDPMLGYTVELTHDGGIITRYSNLKSGGADIKVGDKVESGAVIGVVGDSSNSELAEEPHLHFEMLAGGKKVNPLDYITEGSKRASLGIGSK